MKISKAVITAAGRRQRTLPLQTLIDRDGVEYFYSRSDE